MNSLNKPINDFNFVEREKVNGKYISNKCGRDFLYFTLDFYNPKKYKYLLDLDKELGYKIPPIFAWSLMQFVNIGSFLNKNKLKLFINNKIIYGFKEFFDAITFSKISYKEAIKQIEDSIDSNIVSGVDVSIGFGGLLDHVIFVYGYDADNLYVLDTHIVKNLEYQKLHEKYFFMRLPKQVIKDRWTRFSRIWRVETI